jgi:hypothetical protein
MEGVKKKLENPIVAALTMIALVGTGLTAIGGISGAWDSSHTTEAELVASHPVAMSELTEIADRSICATLDLKISIVEEQIFQMEHSNQSTSRLVEKKRLLIKLEKQFDNLKCASLLGQT